MNEFDGIIKFMQSPLGRMIFNACKDAVTNHVIPYYRHSAMKPSEMTPEQQEERAREEFATVDDFDIQHPASTTPEDPLAPPQAKKKYEI